jgi:hypothetical protein
LAEFSRAWFRASFFPVSAIMTEGIEPLMNAVLSARLLPESALAPSGERNVGKSTEESPNSIAASSAKEIGPLKLAIVVEGPKRRQILNHQCANLAPNASS